MWEIWRPDGTDVNVTAAFGARSTDGYEEHGGVGALMDDGRYVGG